MKIAVLGTGIVGQMVAGKLTELGHDVSMGTRDAHRTLKSSEANRMTGIVFNDWYSQHQNIQLLEFGTVAKDAEIVINATSGKVSLSVLRLVGENNLNGKVLIDIANPLDFSKGYASIDPVNDDSLAEQIQREFPKLKVVKTLNTMNASVMIHPGSIKGDHNVFLSGNDIDAKNTVSDILTSFGWKRSSIIDLGEITSARGAEMLLPIWIQLYTKFGHPNFNFHIQSGE